MIEISIAHYLWKSKIYPPPKKSLTDSRRLLSIFNKYDFKFHIL